MQREPLIEDGNFNSKKQCICTIRHEYSYTTMEAFLRSERLMRKCMSDNFQTFQEKNKIIRIVSIYSSMVYFLFVQQPICGNQLNTNAKQVTNKVFHYCINCILHSFNQTEFLNRCGSRRFLGNTFLEIMVTLSSFCPF